MPRNTRSKATPTKKGGSKVKAGKAAVMKRESNKTPAKLLAQPETETAYDRLYAKVKANQAKRKAELEANNAKISKKSKEENPRSEEPMEIVTFEEGDNIIEMAVRAGQEADFPPVSEEEEGDKVLSDYSAEGEIFEDAMNKGYGKRF